MAPYRARYGDGRPPRLAGLALPPAPMGSRLGLRPLKAWRYVGVFGPELMLCAAAVRVGPGRQWFWAIWDRCAGRLREHTTRHAGEVELGPGRVAIHAAALSAEVTFAEGDGIETISPSGRAHAWTRKQGGLAARGSVRIDGGPRRPIAGHAIVDDSAGYHARHTRWRWSAGVGRTPEGRAVAWNLVDGIHDDPDVSECTIWIDGIAAPLPPVPIAPDLRSAGALRFTAEAQRCRRENLLLVRSRYRQPFGTFAGALPDGTALGEGWGVMEDHDVRW